MSKYRDLILKSITDATPEYISGEGIAKHLNVSRMTVKKVIDQLKEDGISIDSVQYNGHRLNQYPDQWYNGILQSILEDIPFIEKSYTYDALKSTQITAKSLLIEEEKPFIVISDEQTAGTGRFKRAWNSSKGKGVWMSFVVRPNVPFSMLTTFNLFISLAICETIQTYVNEPVKIKWPNDIYIGTRKVCGFLTEMVANADRVDAVICGIGINLNHNAEDFSGELAEKATSVRLHSHQETIERYQFLKQLLKNIENRYHQFLNEPFTSIKDDYIAASNIWNRRLRFTEAGNQFYGQVIEIDDQGFLHVEDDHQKVHRLMSADIDF